MYPEALTGEVVSQINHARIYTDLLLYVSNCSCIDSSKARITLLTSLTHLPTNLTR